VAVLVHDPALLDEPALVESVRATAALVLEISDSLRRYVHSWPRFGRPASASSLPPTPNVAGSSATCTMAHSSGW
jgi:hypothetical protein